METILDADALAPKSGRTAFDQHVAAMRTLTESVPVSTGAPDGESSV